MYPQENMAMSLDPTRLSLRQQTEQRYARAKDEIARCEELLSLLDSNPEVQRIIDLLYQNS